MRGRFAVIQACNPPDIFWPLAMAFKAVERTKFVFDHHDLCPELFESRFAAATRCRTRGCGSWSGARTAAADHVISTNESYRDIAISSSGKDPADVTVVRTGPDPDKLHARPAGARAAPRAPVPGRVHRRHGPPGRRGHRGTSRRRHRPRPRARGHRLHAYRLGRLLRRLVALRDELKLSGHVEFTGRAPDELVGKVMSTADVGLSPDPMNPLNDLSTMNKTMEYMSFELPVVAFDLRETRVSAGDAAVYVRRRTRSGLRPAIVDSSTTSRGGHAWASSAGPGSRELAWPSPGAGLPRRLRRASAAGGGQRPRRAKR